MSVKNWNMDITTPVEQLRLRFVLHGDSPNWAQKPWAELRTIILSGSIDVRRSVMKKWLSCCMLEANRRLPFLERAECGIGGDNNIHLQFTVSKSDFKFGSANTQSMYWKMTVRISLLTELRIVVTKPASDGRLENFMIWHPHSVGSQASILDHRERIVSTDTWLFVVNLLNIKMFSEWLIVWVYQEECTKRQTTETTLLFVFDYYFIFINLFEFYSCESKTIVL